MNLARAHKPGTNPNPIGVRLRFYANFPALAQLELENSLYFRLHGMENLKEKKRAVDF